MEKRAMAVKVDAIVGVAGFIKPGHRVDVLVTLRPSEKQADSLTKIVLENIVVLAVGTEVERKGKEREASVVPVITLEVAPEETEKLALAVSQGEVRLALRSVHDERQGAQPVLTAGATIPMLVSSYSSVPPPPPSVRKPKAVEVLKGGHVEVVTVAK
jgi:pilus assembly protein CpaB